MKCCPRFSYSSSSLFPFIVWNLKTASCLKQQQSWHWWWQCIVCCFSFYDEELNVYIDQPSFSIYIFVWNFHSLHILFNYLSVWSTSDTEHCYSSVCWLTTSIKALIKTLVGIFHVFVTFSGGPLSNLIKAQCQV